MDYFSYKETDFEFMVGSGFELIQHKITEKAKTITRQFLLLVILVLLMVLSAIFLVFLFIAAIILIIFRFVRNFEKHLQF